MLLASPAHPSAPAYTTTHASNNSQPAHPVSLTSKDAAHLDMPSGAVEVSGYARSTMLAGGKQDTKDKQDQQQVTEGPPTFSCTACSHIRRPSWASALEFAELCTRGTRNCHMHRAAALKAKQHHTIQLLASRQFYCTVTHHLLHHSPAAPACPERAIYRSETLTCCSPVHACAPFVNGRHHSSCLGHGGFDRALWPRQPCHWHLKLERLHLKLTGWRTESRRV
jgi:hypothetical protein